NPTIPRAPRIGVESRVWPTGVRVCGRVAASAGAVMVARLVLRLLRCGKGLCGPVPVARARRGREGSRPGELLRLPDERVEVDRLLEVAELERPVRDRLQVLDRERQLAVRAETDAGGELRVDLGELRDVLAQLLVVLERVGVRRVDRVDDLSEVLRALLDLGAQGVPDARDDRVVGQVLERVRERAEVVLLATERAERLTG